MYNDDEESDVKNAKMMASIEMKCDDFLMTMRKVMTKRK